MSERETDIHSNNSRSKDTETEREKYYSENSQVSEAGSDGSDRSDNNPSFNFKCYHDGCKCGHTCDFQTDNKKEYERHGALKHPKNPLLYPSEAEMKKYGLKPQGKSWEI